MFVDDPVLVAIHGHFRKTTPYYCALLGVNRIRRAYIRAGKPFKKMPGGVGIFFKVIRRQKEACGIVYTRPVIFETEDLITDQDSGNGAVS
jgi:hypothetical protein